MVFLVIVRDWSWFGVGNLFWMAKNINEIPPAVYAEHGGNSVNILVWTGDEIFGN